MTAATLYLLGQADREVLPDRVVVSVRIRTGLHRSSQAAIADAAACRARLLQDLGARLPEADIRDAAIATEAQTKRVEVRVPRDPHNPDAGSTTETRYDHLGFVGTSTIRIESAAEAAAASLSACAMHPDTYGTGHRYVVSPELARTVRHELECGAITDALARADGLAAAAACRVSGVVSIGEAPHAEPREDYAFQERAMMSPSMGDWDADDLEDALGELRPEPELFSVAVPVRLAITPAG